MTTASTAKAKVATFEGGGDDMDLLPGVGDGDST